MINDGRLVEIMKSLTTRQPATSEQIHELHAAIGVTLPVDYVDFMLVSNGADGPLGETGYVSLWQVQEIAQLNKDYRVADFAPGLLLFGSDGGDEAFAFDTRTDPMAVVGVPFIGMSLSEAKPLAGTFTDFLTGVW